MKLSKIQRQELLEKYSGRCAYCGCNLEKGWHADHIEPIVRDFNYNSDKHRFEQNGNCKKPQNNHFLNLNPACPSCNRMKNSLSLEQFRNLINGFVNSLNSYSNQYKFAKKYGLVNETKEEVKFYFETL